MNTELKMAEHQQGQTAEEILAEAEQAKAKRAEAGKINPLPTEYTLDN